MTAAVVEPMDGIAPRGDTPERIALLTPTGRDAAVALGERERPHAAQAHLVQRLQKIDLRHLGPVAPRGIERGLVAQVLQVGPAEAGRQARQRGQVHVGGERQVAAVDAQDPLAAVALGQGHLHLAVEATGAQQRRVEHVGPVGRRQHDHLLPLVEAVHLHQQLVEGLLPFVVGAEGVGAATARHRIQLVDKDNGGGRLLRLGE